MNYCKSFARWTVVFTLLLSAIFFTSCKSPSSGLELAEPTAAAGAADGSVPGNEVSTEIIGVGDSLIIVFSDVADFPKDFDVRVNDEGAITLIQNQKFIAAGKTRAQLEKEIRERYVPKYYVRMTATIKPQERLFYVRGEVRGPGRQAYLGYTTVLKAIASAGDFTDYAQRKKVSVTHLNGKKQIINCTKAIQDPRLDLPVYPGDIIYVPRKFL